MPSRYDERYQKDSGLLTQELRDRITAVKIRHGMSYAKLGAELGFSGSFVRNLVEGYKAISAQNIPGLISKLERLEAQNDREVQSGRDGRERKPLGSANLEDLAWRANALGFRVSFAQAD